MVQSHLWFFKLLIWLIPVLTAISWREAVKAWVSHFRGDSTAKMFGLASFSLTKNLNPLGSALSPLLLILGQDYVYGWVDKTDVRPRYLNRGLADTILVLMSAILFNLLFAAAWAYVGHGAKLYTSGTLMVTLIGMSKAGIHINLMLFIVHLIPLPPLDMSLIVREFFPRYPKAFYVSLDPIGHIVVFALLATQIALPFIEPIYNFVYSGLFNLLGFTI